MYEGSLGFRNLSFAALSKDSVILLMFAAVPYGDPFNFSAEIICVHLKDTAKCHGHYLRGTSELGGSQTLILAGDLHLDYYVYVVINMPVMDVHSVGAISSNEAGEVVI
jgi:hypothetical protein